MKTTVFVTEIIDLVTVTLGKEKLFRPDLAAIQCQDYISRCMEDCWEELPEARPDFRTIRTRLKPMREGLYVHLALIKY